MSEPEKPPITPVDAERKMAGATKALRAGGFEPEHIAQLAAFLCGCGASGGDFPQAVAAGVKRGVEEFAREEAQRAAQAAQARAAQVQAPPAHPALLQQLAQLQHRPAPHPALVALREALLDGFKEQFKAQLVRRKEQ